MSKVAVILSGCGYQDGSEIRESVLTLLALEKHQLPYQCLAPDIKQTQVIDHLHKKSVDEVRQVLVESARIARGDVLDIVHARAEDYSAAIFVGGYGVATNLSDFATKGESMCVIQPVLTFARGLTHMKKPLGFICIAPVLAPAIVGSGVRLTIGNDREIAKTLTQMGCEHVNCEANQFIVDKNHKVVTTPAYMLAASIKEVEQGIYGLVNQIAGWLAHT